MRLSGVDEEEQAGLISRGCERSGLSREWREVDAAPIVGELAEPEREPEATRFGVVEERMIGESLDVYPERQGARSCRAVGLRRDAQFRHRVLPGFEHVCEELAHVDRRGRVGANVRPASPVPSSLPGPLGTRRLRQGSGIEADEHAMTS